MTSGEKNYVSNINAVLDNNSHTIKFGLVLGGICNQKHLSVIHLKALSWTFTVNMVTTCHCQYLHLPSTSTKMLSQWLIACLLPESLTDIDMVLTNTPRTESILLSYVQELRAELRVMC